MTTLQTIHTEYIRYANRTLECVEVRSENPGYRYFWIYNFQGIHFRVFGSEVEALAFLNNESDNNWIAYFEEEEELDNFLLKTSI